MNKVRKQKDSGNKDESQRVMFLFFVSLLFFLMALPGNNVTGQSRLEVGPMAGGSYYFGDLNPGVPFKEPHLAFGGLARYAFTDRIALRGSVIYAGLSGTYDKTEGVLPGVRDNYFFDRHVGDVAVMGEINLFSYDHKYIANTKFTPYLAAGLGGVLYKRVSGGDEKSVFVLSLPFGVGVKYKINKWLRVGAEWSFRKLFIDDIEGNMYPESDAPFYGTSKLNNNDWFSVVDVYVTFGLFRRRGSCQSGY
jgi:opacity protein-like surface antigen